MSFRPNLLTKKYPFRIHLSIESLQLNPDKCALFEKQARQKEIYEEFAIFYRRGARNSSGTRFLRYGSSTLQNGATKSTKKESNIHFDSESSSESSNDESNDESSTDTAKVSTKKAPQRTDPNILYFDTSFQFKVTMFQKRNQIKKKVMYLILQRRQASSKVKNPKIVNEAKASVDLSDYALKMIQTETASQSFEEVLTLPTKWGELRLGITLENITLMGGSMETTMMMTTADETTIMDGGPLDDDEDLEEMMNDAENGQLLPDSSSEINQATMQSMEETRRLREKIRDLNREVQSLTIQNEQKLMRAGTKQDIAKLEREKATQQFLAQELKSELEKMREQYENAQLSLKQQLQEEREKSKLLKDGFEQQIKSKEEEIVSLRQRIQTLVTSSNQEDSQRSTAQNQELQTQIRELKEQYEASVQQFDQFKSEREKHFEAEKKKDALLIRELRQELQSYQSQVRRDNEMRSQRDSPQAQTNKTKVREIEQQLEELRDSKRKQEEREQVYLSEIDALKQKMERYELEKLSVELSKESAINEYRSQVLKKEKETLRLQDDLDERIEQEEKLHQEVKDLEQKIATTLIEKAEFEEKMKSDLDYARQRMKELEISLKQQSQTQLVHQGRMVKRGRFIRNWKERWFTLNGVGHLTYYLTENGDVKGGLVVRHVELLSQKSKRMFRLKSSNRQLLCYPKNSADFDKWVASFRTAGIIVEESSR